MHTMTSTERVRAALRFQPVDRVPVAPDCSNMIPAQFTGRPFWEVYLDDFSPKGRNGTPALWKASVAAARHYGYDLVRGLGAVVGDSGEVTRERRVLARTDGFWRVEETQHTPHGDLTTITRYFRAKSPWIEKPLVVDPEEEVEALLDTLADPARLRLSEWFVKSKDELGDDGVVFAGTPVPLAWWLYQRRDLSHSILDFYDRTALVERAMDAYGEWALELLDAQCRLQKPELLLFGGSVSSMSVVSPTLYRRYAYPWLKKACELAGGYGVPTIVHMCGRCRAALDMLVDAGVTAVEPLESPPGGDVTLAEVRERYPRLVLKGNVNTFGTLAQGTAEMVLAEARQCIRDAGPLGFILSTGDQIPNDTPEENLRALVRAAEEG